MVEYILAENSNDYQAAKQLFKEYADDINIDLSFQKFDKELSEIEKMYAPPVGGIILCKAENKHVGCIAIRNISDKVCELKRMYVHPEFRGKGIGKILLEKIIHLAKDYHYELIRLDTLNYMAPAIHLYKEYNFYEIEPYYFNPNSTAIYFEKKLNDE